MERDSNIFSINWLFIALLSVSTAIHGMILFGVPGPPEVEKPSSIPVMLQRDMRPPTRSVPKPPPRAPVSGTRKSASPLAPDPTVPSIAPVPEVSGYIKPVDMPPPETLVPNPEPPSPQAAPRIPSSPSEPGATPESRVGALPSAALSDGPALDAERITYFNGVRRKIESRKKYPEASRRQGMEGKVVASFVINPDGTVSDLTVAEGSGFASLDEAALAAVNDAAPFPALPEGLFKGSVPVKVPILFEMIR